MKIIILSLLMCLSIQGCAQQNEKKMLLEPKDVYEVAKEDVAQTLSKYGLKGRVKTVSQTTVVETKDFVIDFSQYEASDFSEDFNVSLLSEMDYDCEVVFDEKGNLINRITYSESFSEKIIDIDSLHYNANGNLILIKSKRTGDDFPYEGEIKYAYDKNGHLIKIVRDDDTEWRYTYDEKKNQIREVCFVDGEFSSDNTCTFNKYGQRVEKKNYNKDGEVIDNWTYEYDEQGKKRKEILNYPNGDSHIYNLPEMNKTYRQYDSKGNCTTRIVVDNEGNFWILKRKFEYYK